MSVAGTNTDALTLNAIESEELSGFIVEQVYARPEFSAVHGQFKTGIKMKQQIVFASLMGKVGLKKGGTTCSRQTSGAESVLTEKYWNPEGIEDTIILCPDKLNSLFKAYFGKINSYKERYEIEGSDLEIFVTILVEEAMTELIWRAAWFGDTEVAEAEEAAAGLVSAGNVKFYDYFDGLWKQIFEAVTATTVERYTISKNAETTIAAQMALGVGDANAIFEGMRAKADPRLKAMPDAKIFVTNSLFENQRQYLESKSLAFTLDVNMSGFSELTWQGNTIVNMETVWDKDLYADFVDNTDNEAYYLPHRAVYTIPENIPLGTLNENDMSELEIWYEKKERENNIAFGFDLDAKLLEEDLIVVAY